VPDRKLPILDRLLTRRRLLGAGAAGLGATLVVLPGVGPACCPEPEPDGGFDGGHPDGGDAGDAGDSGTSCPASDDKGACAPGKCAVDKNTLVLALADHPELVAIVSPATAQYACNPACGQPGTPYASETPETGQGWGVYCDDRFSDPCWQQNAIIVLHTGPSTYVALSASCTHMACTVALSSDASGLLCPCHGSYYSLTGEHLSGPAPFSLTALPVCFDGCAVYVQLSSGGSCDPDGG
jgi:Rieske Fe-S protein